VRFVPTDKTASFMPVDTDSKSAMCGTPTNPSTNHRS